MSQPTQSDVDAIASTYWDALKIIDGAISRHMPGNGQCQQIAASIIAQLSYAGLNIFSEKEIDRIRQESQP